MTTKNTAKPGAMLVKDYLTLQIEASGKTQAVIAGEVGFENANMITMLKKGKLKLPINKIAPMAKALGIDQIHFFRLVMNEYQPGNWALIEEILKGPVLTISERKVINAMRDANGESSLGEGQINSITAYIESIKKP